MVTKPIPKLATIDRVEVFEAGLHQGDEYTPAMLDQAVANFHRFAGAKGEAGGIKVNPLILAEDYGAAVLGHDTEQAVLKSILQDDSGAPTAGIVTNLWREGTKLFANLGDVPEPVAKLVNQRAYRTVSAEFWQNFQDQGVNYGLVLKRVALLGAEQPQVKGLADLPLARFTDQATPATVRTVRTNRGTVVCFRSLCMRSNQRKGPAMVLKTARFRDKQLRRYGAEIGTPASSVRTALCRHVELASARNVASMMTEVRSYPAGAFGRLSSSFVGLVRQERREAARGGRRGVVSFADTDPKKQAADRAAIAGDPAAVQTARDQLLALVQQCPPPLLALLVEFASNQPGGQQLAKVNPDALIAQGAASAVDQQPDGDGMLPLPPDQAAGRTPADFLQAMQDAIVKGKQEYADKVRMAKVIHHPAASRPAY